MLKYDGQNLLILVVGYTYIMIALMNILKSYRGRNFMVAHWYFYYLLVTVAMDT